MSECPECGGDLVIRCGSNGGEFYGCSNFPTCRHTESLDDYQWGVLAGSDIIEVDLGRNDIATDWYSVTDRGMRLLREPTPEEYAYAGAQWAALLLMSPMGIGDWFNIGEETFKERAAAYWSVFDPDRHEMQTLYNYKSVAKRVPFERRESGLLYAHYDAVASLEPGEQIVWQRMALACGWSGSRLRKNLRIAKGRFEITLDFACVSIVSQIERARDLTQVPELLRKLDDAIRSISEVEKEYKERKNGNHQFVS